MSAHRSNLSRLVALLVASALALAGLLAAPAASAETMVTLSGVVTKSDGSPVAGLRVAWNYGQYGQLGGLSALTDSTGAYSLDVSPGEGQISFSTAGGETASDLTLPRYFEWKATQTLSAKTTWDLALPPLRTITYEVVDVHGTPISGATVKSEDGPRCTTPWTAVQPVPCFWAPRSGVTDGNGAFTVAVFDKANSEPVSFVVTAPDDGGVVMASGVVDADSTIPVTVQRNVIAGTLAEAAATGDPTPIQDAYVSFEAAGTFFKQTRTDASGAFSLTVPTISGRLSVQTYRVDSPGGSVVAASPTMPQITSWVAYDASTSRDDLQLLLPEALSVAVSVIDDGTEAPIEGATLDLVDTVKNQPTEAPCTRPLLAGSTPHCLWVVLGNAATDVNGQTTAHVVSAAESGPYALVGIHPTDTARRGQATGSDADVTIRIQAARTVSGTVTDASGAPLRNVRVAFLNYTTNSELSTVTGTDGTYSLAVAPGWGYLAVSAYSDQWPYEAGSHPMSPDTPVFFRLDREHTQGEASVAGIDLIMPTIVTQTFQVVDAQGQKVPNATVGRSGGSCSPLPDANTLTWRACSWSATASTMTADADGYFSTKVFVGNSIRLSATDPANAGRTGWVSAPFTADQVTPIVLPDPPAPPAAVDATAPDATSVDVTWQPPTDDGGSAITGYDVTAEPAPLVQARSLRGSKVAILAQAVVTATQALGPDARSVRLTGLTSGTPYVVSVRAKNAVGSGQPTTTTITPGVVGQPPSAPGTPTAVAGDRSATVTWAAATSAADLPVLDYTVTSIPDGKTCTTTGLTCTVSTLANGVGYTFTVHARNAVGDGPESSASSSVVPKGTPDAVGSLTLTASAPKQLTASWAAASANGSPVTRYEYRYRKASSAAFTAWTSVKLSTSVAIKKLSAATAYVVEVRAVNAVGVGTVSSASATTR